jgi:putative ABC transport system ATP-binding protein
MPPVIDTRALTKTYQVGEIDVPALKGVDLLVENGEFVAIMGASGSGKSTLMNLLGCLDRATSGDYFLDGLNVNAMDSRLYADIRNQKIGFVFQGFNLLSRTTALENVELPLIYDRIGRIHDIKKASIAALEKVGLSDRIYHFPNQLSGGQQQRVAIARALVTQPKMVLADEPTGNLDSKTSLDVLSLFQELNEQGITIVLVTHDAGLANYAKRIVELRDGLVIRDESVANPKNAGKNLSLHSGSNDEAI